MKILFNLCAFCAFALSLIPASAAPPKPDPRERALTVTEAPIQRMRGLLSPRTAPALSSYDRDVLRLSREMMRFIGRYELELGGEVVVTGPASRARWQQDGGGVLYTGPLRIIQWGANAGTHPARYGFSADAGERWWIGRKCYMPGLPVSYQGPPTSADYDYAKQIAIWQLAEDPAGFAPARWVPVVPVRELGPLAPVKARKARPVLARAVDPRTLAAMERPDWLDRLFPGSTFDQRTWTTADWMRHDIDRDRRHSFASLRVTGRAE